MFIEGGKEGERSVHAVRLKVAVSCDSNLQDNFVLGVQGGKVYGASGVWVRKLPCLCWVQETAGREKHFWF